MKQAKTLGELPYLFRGYCAKYRQNEHFLLIFRGEPTVSFAKVGLNRTNSNLSN